MILFSDRGSRVRVTLVPLTFLPFLLSLPSVNADCKTDPHAGPENCLPPTPSKFHRLPTLALLAIVCVALFVVIFGCVLIYLYARQQRVRHKREEHRRRTAQFQQMHRQGTRPFWQAPGLDSSNSYTPIPKKFNSKSNSSLSSSASSFSTRSEPRIDEVMVVPQYPTKALVMS